MEIHSNYIPIYVFAMNNYAETAECILSISTVCLANTNHSNLSNTKTDSLKLYRKLYVFCDIYGDIAAIPCCL